MDLKKLAEPFPASDIEWRVGRAGTKEGSGPWATVLAYVTNRAIMERLDAVVGPGNWQNEFRPWETGAAGVMCGIGILTEAGWVWKWDGAEQPKERGEGQLVAVKGGFSMSMKRTAVQWGIGRYLYDLEEGFAKVSPTGKHYQPAKKESNGKPGYPAFKWDPPALPVWALPSGAKNGAGVKSANAADSERSTRGESGGGTDAAVTTQPARQQAAPASRPAVEKVPIPLKLGGVPMNLMSNEELEKLRTEKANDPKYAKHVAEATRLLDARTMAAKFDEEKKFQDALPF